MSRRAIAQRGSASRTMFLKGVPYPIGTPRSGRSRTWLVRHGERIPPHRSDVAADPGVSRGSQGTILTNGLADPVWCPRPGGGAVDHGDQPAPPSAPPRRADPRCADDALEIELSEALELDLKFTA